MATVFCVNISFANLVVNGGFDTPVILVTNDTLWSDPPGSVSNWYVGINQLGLYFPEATIAPLSGQIMYDNGSGAARMMQTFPGVKLQPDSIYTFTFDAYSRSGWEARSINAGLYHGSGSGQSSSFTSEIDAADMISVTASNGTVGVWTSGANFSTLIEPPPNDPSIYHELKIVTASTLSGPNVGLDIGVAFWGGAGPQLHFDNVKVEVIPEPAVLGFLGLLGLAFLRKK